MGWCAVFCWILRLSLSDWLVVSLTRLSRLQISWSIYCFEGSLPPDCYFASCVLKPVECSACMAKPLDERSKVKLFFTETEEESKWKCRCGKTLTQKKNTGWTNLLIHIRRQHSETEVLQESKPQTTSSDTSDKASKEGKQDLCCWLNW